MALFDQLFLDVYLNLKAEAGIFTRNQKEFKALDYTPLQAAF